MQITEAGGAPTITSRGRVLLGLITPGWGSSGFYSAKVLENAASDKVWPKGTHVFFDHPSESEEYDRPERSVRDLAAVTTEDAYVGEGGGLVAAADVIGPYRDLVTDPVFVEAVGMSIRSTAETTPGEAEGRKGTIITRLVEGLSVDLVTRAGRGGKVLAVLESARAEESRRIVAEARNVGQWIESRLHLSLTQIGDDMFGEGRITREERIALSGAVGDGLTAFTAALEGSAPQLYQRDLWQEPEPDVVETDESAPDVPAPAGQQHPTQESEEDTMPQIEEARLRQLETDAGRATTAESERATAISERDDAVAKLAEAHRTIDGNAARDVVRAAAREAAVDLNDFEVAGIAADYPTGEAGRLDTAALTETAKTAVAALAEARGTGRVTGFGGSPTRAGEVSEADARAFLYGTEQKGA